MLRLNSAAFLRVAESTRVAIVVALVAYVVAVAVVKTHVFDVVFRLYLDRFEHNHSDRQADGRTQILLVHNIYEC